MAKKSAKVSAKVKVKVKVKNTKLKKTPPKKVKAVKSKPAPKKKIALKKASPQQAVNKKTNKNVSKTVNSKLLNEGAPFSPLGDKVLIKRADASFEKTAGGLYIPSTAQEKPTEGKVVAVGPGVKTKKGFLKPLDVKVGDKVMYEKYAGMELKFNGQEFLILTENEIIGVVS